MRYQRSSLQSTLQTATHAAQAWGESRYVYATYNGFTVERRLPPFGQAYYEATPAGVVTLHELPTADLHNPLQHIAQEA